MPAFWVIGQTKCSTGVWNHTAFGPLAFGDPRHKLEIKTREPALKPVRPFGIGTDEQAGCVFLNAIGDDNTSLFRRGPGDLFKLGRKIFFLIAFIINRATGISRDIGFDTAGMDASDTDVGSGHFCGQGFGKAANAEFRCAIAGLAGHTQHAKMEDTLAIWPVPRAFI